MINVSNNRATVEMSKQSVTPIKYVPYIVLYFNMKPFMVYKGPYVADEIRRFIIEVANNIQKKQQFSKAQIKQDDQEGGIPAYTVGRPVCGDDKVCYLEFLSAYQK